MSTLVLAAGGAFEAPGPQSFEFPAIFGAVTKPVLLIALSLVLIAGFYLYAMRKPALVPGKLQFVAEGSYDFVRNTLGRENIGSKDFLRFVPFLLTLFTFILVNNFFGFIPVLQFPTMSHIAFPYVLAIMVWVIYNAVGIGRHGLLGYLKVQTMPPGVPVAILPLVMPIEFISNLVVRPISLSLRLFANMFAGHLILLVFTLGGQYLLIHGGIGLKLASPFAFALAIVLMFFELLVQFLQAYIFTILTASYLGGALAEEH